MSKAKKIQVEVGPTEEEKVIHQIDHGDTDATMRPEGPKEQEVDANGRKKVVTITHEELEQKGLKNKSQVIRYLDSEGFSRSSIAGFLGVRYQHVRNVLVTELKKPQ